MRDIAVLLLVMAGCVAALKRPYIGILLWVWIGVMNPHRLSWSFAYSLPFAQMAALATFAGFVLTRDRIKFPFVAPNIILMLFLMWMGITTLTAMVPDESARWFMNTFKVFLMTFVAFMLIHTRQHINLLVWVLVISLGFYGVKGGIFTIRGGGEHRVWGPPTSFIESNNELAVALIMAIPLMYYLITQSSKKWVKLGLYASIALSAVAALGTHSRGAILAIAAMALPFWWRSNNKAAIGAMFLVGAPLIVMFMPEHWVERMHSIANYEEDSSALGRLNAWQMSINIAADRLFGAGFAVDSPHVYQLYAPDPTKLLVAHSIYFQVLGSHGYVGLVLFLLLWWTTLRLAGRAEKLSAGNPDQAWIVQLTRMIRVSFIAYLVGGAFLNLAYFDVPYYMMVLVVAVYRLAEQAKAEAPATGPSTLAGIGIAEQSRVGYRSG